MMALKILVIVVVMIAIYTVVEMIYLNNKHKNKW